MHVWDSATGLETLSLPNHGAPVRSVSFAAEGHTIETACQPQGVYRWQALDWKALGDRTALERWHREEHTAWKAQLEQRRRDSFWKN